MSQKMIHLKLRKTTAKLRDALPRRSVSENDPCSKIRPPAAIIDRFGNPGRTRTAVSTPGRYRLRTFAQFGKLAHEESGKRGLPNRFIFTPRNRFSAHRPCGNETAQRPAACAAPHLARALRQRSSRSPPPHIPRKHACPPKPAGKRTHSIEAGPTAVRRRPASAATRGSWTCCAST